MRSIKRSRMAVDYRRCYLVLRKGMGRVVEVASHGADIIYADYCAERSMEPRAI